MAVADTINKLGSSLGNNAVLTIDVYCNCWSYLVIVNLVNNPLVNIVSNSWIPVI